MEKANGGGLKKKVAYGIARWQENLKAMTLR